MNKLKVFLTIFTLIFTFACGESKENVGQTFNFVSGPIYIGDTTVESTGDNGNGNLLVAQSAVLGEQATLQSMSFYVTSASGQLRLGLYDATGPSGGPGHKLAETASFTPTNGWNTVSITSVSLAPATYWLTYLPSSNGLAFVKRTNITTSKYYSFSYGSMPTTFSTSPSTSTSRWSLYATLIPDSSSNLQPTISTQASANPNPVNTTSSNLSVLAADDGGEAALSYTWSLTGTPPSSVTFSTNNNNAAKNTTVTFNKFGTYQFQVVATDTGGLTASSTISVSVNQVTTNVIVSPASVSIQTGNTQQFTALANDQFGTQISPSPSFAWNATGGSISGSGLFTAGQTSGSFNVSATVGSVNGSANVNITLPPPVTFNMGETSVQNHTDNGNSLLFAQSTTLSQSGTLQSLSFYATSATGKFRLGIYDATGSGGGPGQKLVETSEVTPVTGWNTVSISAVLLNPGTYWLAYLPSSNGLMCNDVISFVKTTGNNSKYYSYPYGQLPSTFSTSSNISGVKWSIYATLTQTNSCAGVTCNTPPASQCLNNTTLRNYTSPGTCSNGNCSYAPSDVTCPNTCQGGICTSSAGLPGPLTVSPNPNYFQDNTGQAIALFGSHTWNNFQDWGTNGTVQTLDFDNFVSFLTNHGQNFTLLWRTELPKFCNLSTISNGASPDFTTSFQPWLRTGPGNASDGGLKFDLNQFNQAYFDRLRSRVSKLNDAGVWTGVYLFSGEWLNAFRCSTDGYPLTGGNNINSINDGGGNGSITMSAPNSITAIQDAMVSKTIDTLNDLPNFIWIVSEEASANSVWWNNHMISLVHNLESTKPYKHPVGFATMEPGTSDDVVINSNADWISPVDRISSSSTCGTGTPQCKVNINDSDHSYFGMWNESEQANRQYAWENFTRGNQVVFMDPYLVYYPRENRNLCQSPTNGICSNPDSRWDNFRNNLGYMVTLSQRMNLNVAGPLNSLCSTGYCLGQTPTLGTEILVYSPDGGNVTVNLSSSSGRTLNYEWLDPVSGMTVSGGQVSGGNQNQLFSTPASITSDSVLYIVDSMGHGE